MGQGHMDIEEDAAWFTGHANRRPCLGVSLIKECCPGIIIGAYGKLHLLSYRNTVRSLGGRPNY